MNNFYTLLQRNFFFVLMILIASSCTESSKATINATDTSANGYQLVWSDEFDGNAVDTSSWNFEIGGEGWGNHEQEYYQPANATLANGNLVITGKKEDVGSNHYTSTRMTTKGKREFQYGKIEARIKIPVGQGFWPAFWMLGSNISAVGWPKSGEIDIMEHINTDSLMYGTLHWDNNGHVQSGDTLTSTPSDYHIYGIEWDSSAIRWYIDGEQFHEVNIHNGANSTTEFHQPFFLLLNLALGGDWPGQTIDDSKLPTKMFVDYVRVYQKK
ncbi:MAG: glycoside hydrolase family 16 protein [Ilyomonas sp.]